MARSGSALTSLSSPKSVKSSKSTAPEIDWEHHVFIEAEEPANHFDRSDSRQPSRAQSRRGNRVRVGRSGQLRRYATVEECPLPAVPVVPDQQLALPCNIQISHTLRIPVDEFEIRFEAPRAKAAWKQWALSPLSLELFRDAFWWVLVEEFKKQTPDGPPLQEFLFDRTAHNYTKLLLPEGDKQAAPNDGYLDILALVMAQGLLRAFQVAFPKSKHKFNEAFYRRLLRYMTQWTVSTPRTRDDLRDVSHQENAFVGRLIDPNEVRQDFSYDASMSAKAIEQWRATYLPPAHDLYNKDRHSLLISHFLTSHGILEPPFNKHAYSRQVGGVKSRTAGKDSSPRGSRPRGELESSTQINGDENDTSPPGDRVAGQANGQGKKKTKGTGPSPEKDPRQQLGIEVPPRLKTAVSALLAAGLDAQEAVALVTFMHSGSYDSDDEEEVSGFKDAGPARAREQGDAQSVSYAAIAAGSFENARQALDRYTDVRKKGLSSVEVTHKETSHLLQELRHLWGHVGRRDARYISNALSKWEPIKPVVTESSQQAREKESQAIRREVEQTLARSSRERQETERFLGSKGPGFSWRKTPGGQWRARFEKGEAEEVLGV